MHDKSFLAVHEEFGHVLECDCGSIQMRVGPVTLALDESALRRLHEMVTEAVGKLDAASDKVVQDDPLVSGAVRSAWASFRGRGTRNWRFDRGAGIYAECDWPKSSLDGLDHVMSPGILPDARIVTWILASAKQ